MAEQVACTLTCTRSFQVHHQDHPTERHRIPLHNYPASVTRPSMINVRHCCMPLFPTNTAVLHHSSVPSLVFVIQCFYWITRLVVIHDLHHPSMQTLTRACMGSVLTLCSLESEYFQEGKWRVLALHLDHPIKQQICHHLDPSNGVLAMPV